MTVQDLIDELKKHDPSQRVMTEDNGEVDRIEADISRWELVLVGCGVRVPWKTEDEC